MLVLELCVAHIAFGLVGFQMNVSDVVHALVFAHEGGVASETGIWTFRCCGGAHQLDGEPVQRKHLIFTDTEPPNAVEKPFAGSALCIQQIWLPIVFLLLLFICSSHWINRQLALDKFAHMCISLIRQRVKVNVKRFPAMSHCKCLWIDLPYEIEKCAQSVTGK